MHDAQIQTWWSYVFSFNLFGSEDKISIFIVGLLSLILYLKAYVGILTMKWLPKLAATVHSKILT